MIKKLAKLANSLDKLSLSKEADIIDVIIKKIAQISIEQDSRRNPEQNPEQNPEPDIDHDVLKNTFAKIFNKYIDAHNEYVEEYAAKGLDVGELEERINPDDVEFEWIIEDETSRWIVKNKTNRVIKEFDAWIEKEGAYPEYSIERVMARDNDEDKTPKEFIIYWEV